MSEPSNPSWRYGVALFPLPPILSLVSLGSMQAFISLSVTDQTSVLVGIAAFFLTVLSNWLAIIVAAVVAVSVFLDARALAGREDWSPNRYAFGVVGLVHLAGSMFLYLNLLSVPSLVYYLYQRRQSVS